MLDLDTRSPWGRREGGDTNTEETEAEGESSLRRVRAWETGEIHERHHAKGSINEILVGVRSLWVRGRVGGRT